VVNRRQIVDPPTFTPLPYGLLSVTQNPTTADAHWANGITYQSRCLNAADTTYSSDCGIAVTGTGATTGPAPAPAGRTGNTTLTNRGATAFSVYAEFDCAPVGMADAAKIAEDALAQDGAYDVEHAFWTGVAGGQSVVFPHLASNADVTDNGVLLQSTATVAVTGSSAPTVALGMLEQSIADCSNGVGVIHVQRKVLPTLFYHNLIEVRGGQLVTKSGNLVAAGSGYPGTGPAGQAITATTSWMYATGPVFVYASPTRINDVRTGLDRTTNTMKYIAERTYLLGWDCCHTAVLVDISAA
jgi:hypothetical protein